jgi:hypothetical protein
MVHQIRRRWAQWNRNGYNGNGMSEQLAVASDSAAVSYRELVSSFRCDVGGWSRVRNETRQGGAMLGRAPAAQHAMLLSEMRSHISMS